MRTTATYLPLLGVALFCLTSMAGCPNNVPAGQTTTVQGRVVNLRTGQPMAGVRLALTTAGGFPVAMGGYLQEADSTRTNLRGEYSLSFVNQQGLYYGISCEAGDAYSRRIRLDLPDSLVKNGSPQSLRNIDLVIGQANTISFRPSPRRVFRVQMATRTTGYQRLRFDYVLTLPADNQTRTVYLYQPVPFYTSAPQDFYNRPSTLPLATFSRTLASGVVQDTTVRLSASTPLTGDTVRAALTFGR